MEKASNVYVVPGDFGWSDLGNWDSIHELSEKDQDNNVIEANALVYNSNNCLVKGPKDRLIVVDELDGYLVTEQDNVILICRKDNEKRIRQYVKDAESKGKEFL
jgi:mannose-1-phosphate guanylyltransferase